MRKPVILAVARTLLRVFPGRLGDRARMRRFKAGASATGLSCVLEQSGEF